MKIRQYNNINIRQNKIQDKISVIDINKNIIVNTF